MNRRHFLCTCGSMAGLSVVASWPVLAFSGPLHRIRQLEEISFEAFAAATGTWFAVGPTAAPLAVVELVRAAEKEEEAVGGASRLQSVDASFEKFALVFRGALTAPLDQGTYRFENRRLGSFAIFIAPVVSRDPTRRYYEAVFNRPRGGLSTVPNRREHLPGVGSKTSVS